MSVLGSSSGSHDGLMAEFEFKVVEVGWRGVFRENELIVSANGCITDFKESPGVSAGGY